MDSKKQKIEDNINIINSPTKENEEVMINPLKKLKNENNKKPLNVNSEELMDEAIIKLSNLAKEAKKIWNK